MPLKLIVIVPFLTLNFCASFSTTQTNIKKTNEALLENRDQKKSPPEKTIPAAKKSEEQSDGPIPMSTFMSPPPKNVVLSSNRWFPRIQSWAKIYREIAKQEQDVRNYTLSAKYSTTALLWAKRSLEIKDMPEETAIIYVQLWLSAIKIPELPDEPRYFTGQDAYKKIVETRKILDELKDRLCLISKGVQLIQSLAYFELATDLLHQKKYTKSSIKIQTVSGFIGNIENEKKLCPNYNSLLYPK